MVFRPDIDGLRGVAVLAVLVFHLLPAALPGGFVGVDVFFVISGYLVTQLSVRRVQAGQFTWADFVARRAVRLLPALGLVLLATVAAGSVMLGVDARAALGTEVAAAALFSSNLLSYWTVDYFSAPAESRPLLHLWSLAIEEQFYLLAPVAFVALGRRPRALAWLVGTVVVVSFAAGAALTPTDASAAFYLLPFRAWELGVGALLALAGPRVARVGVAEAGVVAIGLASAFYGHDTPFPGVAALLPVLGAAAVVVGAPGPAGRLLGAAPLQALGRWSYALYLWHWPLVVLARAWLLRAPTPAEALGLGVVSVALAAGTTRFVEGPLRRAPVGEAPVRRRVLAWGAALSALLGVVGAGVWASNGGELPARGRAAGEAEMACLEMPVSLADPRTCRFGPAGGAPAVLVGWGDSHVGMLAPVLEDLGGRLNGGGRVVVRNRCPPVVGAAAMALLGDQDCVLHNEKVLAELLAAPPAAVVLGGRWTLHASPAVQPPRVRSLFLPERPALGEVMRRAVAAAVEPLRAAGVRVVLIDSLPEAGFPVKDAWEQAVRLGRERPQGPTRAAHETLTSLSSPALAAVAAETGALRLRPSEAFCGAERCVLGDEAGAYYTDSNHLGLHGAHRMEPLLRAALGAPAPGAAVD